MEVARKDDCLMQPVDRFWAIENFGVTPDSKAYMSVENKKGLAFMEQSVKTEGGRYQVVLPWKQYPPFLPYNRPMAEQRLQAFKKSFLQDGELSGNYKATMEQYLVQDHTRRVPQNEPHAEDKPLCYLPHHPVFNKPSTVTQNTEEHTGPDLTNSIVGVLTRFREKQLALSADIECMFHQVRVPPVVQDAFRFFWWPDGNLSDEPIDHRCNIVAELFQLCIEKDSR